MHDVCEFIITNAHGRYDFVYYDDVLLELCEELNAFISFIINNNNLKRYATTFINKNILDII